jgi:hypothetical protein
MLIEQFPRQLFANGFNRRQRLDVQKDFYPRCIS